MIRRVTYIAGFLLFALQAPGQQMPNTDTLLLLLRNHDRDDSTKIYLLNDIAYSYMFSEPAKAHEYAQTALNLSNKTGFEKGKALSLMHIGHSYRTRGFFEPAVDFFFGGLKIAEAIGDQKLTARLYNQIGVVYYSLRNYPSGMEYFVKALEIFIKINDQSWIAAVKNNIAMIYESEGDMTRALNYYLEAAVINKEMQNLIWLGNNYGNIGNIYRKKNDPECRRYYMMMYELFDSINNLEGKASALYSEGLYHRNNRRYDKAIELIRQSYALSHAFGSLRSKRSSAEMLGKTLFDIGRHKEAYEYQVIEIALADSINLNEVSQKIARAEMKNLMEKEKETYELKRRLRLRYITAVLIGVGVLLLITALLLYRQKALHKKQNLEKELLRLENHKLEEELGFKNRELQYYVEFLLARNTLLVEIIEQLNNLKEKVLPENLGIINSLIFDLKAGIDSNEWEEFEARFNQINADFYKALLQRHPGLTQNERNLCAYLRLNMTAREISALTKQSVASIDTAKSRLRKKIGVPSGKQLSAYLNELFP